MRRKARTIIYVCSAVQNGNLISRMIESQNIEDSCLFFEKENGIKPQVVLGPFYKKKTNTLEKNTEVKFKFGETKQGIYDGWHVTAMPLVSPADSVYLLFNKRMDDQRLQKPRAMVVKIKEVQELK